MRPSWLDRLGVALRRPREWPRLDIDLRDLHIYGGLGLAALGGWQLSPAWTLVATGVTLTVVGVLGPLLEPRHKGD